MEALYKRNRKFFIKPFKRNGRYNTPYNKSITQKLINERSQMAGGVLKNIENQEEYLEILPFFL